MNIQYHYLLTQRSRVESGPPIKIIPITGNNRFINPISDHHHIPLPLGNQHILFINTSIYINQIIPVTAISLIGSRINRIRYRRKITRPILAHHHHTIHQHSVVRGLRQSPTGPRHSRQPSEMLTGSGSFLVRNPSPVEEGEGDTL